MPWWMLAGMVTVLTADLLLAWFAFLYCVAHYADDATTFPDPEENRATV